MRIHVLSLVVSFCVAVSIMMCLVPKAPVVVKWPRPDTQDHEYRSSDGACFKVAAEKVSCDSGPKVVPQPVHDIDPSANADRGLRFQSPFASSS